MSITLICENAINFNDLTEAKRLIEREAAIKDATGVDIWSKFQAFGKEQIVNPLHYDYCKARMLDEKMVEELFQFGADINQKVFYTIMSPEFVPWTEKIGVEYYKIRYYDRENQEIIKAIDKTKKPFFISMRNFKKINEFRAKYPQAIILYCKPNYPSLPFQYKKAFENKDLIDGLSDHCKGLKLLTEAWNVGFEYHERHVMLNKEGMLEDKWACTLYELNKKLVDFNGKTKICSQCHKEKEFSEFHYEKSKGYRSNCGVCQNKLSKSWYNRHKPERFQYLEERRDHYKELNKDLRERNKETRAKQIKEWNSKQTIKAEGVHGLAAIHRFVRRRKKEPYFCEICNERKKLDLASITHIYTREPKDYIYLCRSCHPIYDQCRRKKAALTEVSL